MKGSRAGSVVLLCCLAGLLAACSSTPRHPAASGTLSRPAATSTTSGQSIPPTSSPTTTAIVAGGVPLCTDLQIVVSDSGGGAGLGHEDQVLVFTNESASACTLAGYPGVAGINAAGQEVAQAERTPGGYLGGLTPGDTSIPVVSLEPGQAASAIVEGIDVPPSEQSCPYYPDLFVTPPNLTKSVRVTVVGLGKPPYKGLPGCAKIQVHPVVSGTSGSVPGF